MSASAAIADSLLRQTFVRQARRSLPRHTVQVCLGLSRLRVPVSRRDCAISSLDCARDPELCRRATNRHESCGLASWLGLRSIGKKLALRRAPFPPSSGDRKCSTTSPTYRPACTPPPRPSKHCRADHQPEGHRGNRAPNIHGTGHLSNAHAVRTHPVY